MGPDVRAAPGPDWAARRSIRPGPAGSGEQESTAGPNPDAGDARWSAGPSLRAGRAFGALEPDRPGPGANRGTYVYGQVGAEWSARGALVVSSLGMTTLALGERILRRHNSTGNNAYLLLLPLALLNHVQLDWALATSGDNQSQVALLHRLQPVTAGWRLASYNRARASPRL